MLLFYLAKPLYYRHGISNDHQFSSPQLSRDIRSEDAVPVDLGGIPYNLTPSTINPGYWLAKRDINFDDVVCKGNGVLGMLRNDPPSPQVWTQRDLDNGWNVEDEFEWAPNESLTGALEEWGIPPEHDDDLTFHREVDQSLFFRGADGQEKVSAHHENETRITHIEQTFKSREYLLECIRSTALIILDQPPTGGRYYNTYIPSHGTIIAENNFAPRYQEPGAEGPPLSRWSDIAWLLWSQKAGNRAGGLRAIIQEVITTPFTRELIEYIEVAEPDNLDLPYPGILYDMRSDYAKALLASPHGVGVAFLLKDHRNVLGPRYPAVRIFTAPNNNRFLPLKFNYFMICTASQLTFGFGTNSAEEMKKGCWVCFVRFLPPDLFFSVDISVTEKAHSKQYVVEDKILGSNSGQVRSDQHARHLAHASSRHGRRLQERVTSPHELPRNSTAVIDEARSKLVKRAVNYRSYVCKGDVALGMIIQDPPATQTWTQQDLTNNGWTTVNDVKEVSADLLPALQGLGVPHAPDRIHPVFADQQNPYTDRNGHPNTPPTQGFYHSKYIPDANKGAIISEASFSPRFKAGPTGEIPRLNRWSDIVWFLWAREAGEQAKNLRYVFRDKINNDETRGIIDKIHQLDEHPDTLDLPWPGHTYDMRTDDGKALLGSPHGIGLAYLIRDHSDVLGRKIPFAHVFTVSNAPPSLSGSEGEESESSSEESEEEESESSESSESSSDSGSSGGPPVYRWNYYVVWELRDTARGDLSLLSQPSSKT
ncbi:MAG: hypothetical protein Q9216_006493 [Gyalolechia sp. 2 TL-2023]